MTTLAERLEKYLIKPIKKYVANPIGEYFLGTESIKSYRRERVFYPEAIINNKSLLETILNNNYAKERAELLIGKVVPDSIIGASVGYYFWTGEAVFSPIIFGETLRIAIMSLFSMYHKTLAKERLRLQKNEIAFEKEKRGRNLEGEEWKLNTDNLNDDDFLKQ